MQGSRIRKISARGSLSRPGNLDLIVSHVDNRAMGGHAQIEYATDAKRKYMMPSYQGGRDVFCVDYENRWDEGSATITVNIEDKRTRAP